MAKIYSGAVQFANGFSYSSAVPMDDRLVVNQSSDLTNESTWSANGVCIAYAGMMVSVVGEETAYIFKGGDVTDITNWARMMAGSSDISTENVSDTSGYDDVFNS